MKTNPKYNQDFYAWALYSAKLLRQGKFKEIDVEHMAEEIESMGSRDKRELVNGLAVLIAHFLKWQFQADRRSNSWKSTIKEQRIQVNDLLEESPSLKHELVDRWNHAYEKAVLLAAAETGFPEKSFPEQCPFQLKQCIDSEFFPE